jgi:cell fate regulator YaaT (PSP1 superfamily)
MACTNCGSATLGGKPAGCRSNGSCDTGGCNRLNSFDWLASVPIPEDQRFYAVEVSFKHGSRKDIYRNSSRLDIMTGDLVVVESGQGFDIGRVSLSGELVKLQMRKRRMNERRLRDLPKVLRKARERDLESLTEARAREGAVMIRARQMTRDMKLEMKIADVEFRGDLRKATFYYTSDDRIDFRDLIRELAQEFRVKVDMRQIGARQEAGKIGGIGACGRELCCSTWLTEFKSVSTAAARYQNLAINQSKLSGQCGRLKCCLNYELDTYVQGMKAFPKGAKRLKTEEGEAILQKTDLFRVLMYYSIPALENTEQYALTPDQVREIQALNERGELAPALSGIAQSEEQEVVEEVGFVENAQVSLRTLERSSRKRKKKKGGKDEKGGAPAGEGRRGDERRGQGGRGEGQRRDGNRAEGQRGDNQRDQGQQGQRRDQQRREPRPERPDRPPTRGATGGGQAPEGGAGSDPNSPARKKRRRGSSGRRGDRPGGQENGPNPQGPGGQPTS